MALLGYCNPDAILCDMEAADKEDALRQLVGALVAAKQVVRTHADRICEEVIERELRATTGIGNGIGIPHARSSHAKKISIAIGKIVEGIDFGAVDGERVRVILLMVSPQDHTDEHLAAMRAIVRMVRDPYQCKRLHGCKTPESFLDLIRENDG